MTITMVAAAIDIDTTAGKVSPAFPPPPPLRVPLDEGNDDRKSGVKLDCVGISVVKVRRSFDGDSIDVGDCDNVSSSVVDKEGGVESTSLEVATDFRVPVKLKVGEGISMEVVIDAD